MIPKLTLLTVMFFFIGCTSDSKSEPDAISINVDFGKIENSRIEDRINDIKFVKLETNDNSLLGKIDQVQVYKDKIYILDSYKTMSVLIFSDQGNYIDKIQGKGNGPGEFSVPNSFFISENGFIYILDKFASKLLKYNLSDLNFAEEITLPARAPLSFWVSEDEKEFYYYCSPASVKETYNKQLLISDKKGNVKQGYIDLPPSRWVLYGNPYNFYSLENTININPYFSNKVYSFSNDSIYPKYNLKFGDKKMMDNNYFKVNENIYDIGRAVFQENTDLINFLYVYESEEQLLVRYFINSKMYVGIYDKNDRSTLNIDYDSAQNINMLGGVFPYPIGVTEDGYWVGEIKPDVVNQDLNLNTQLKNIIEYSPMEDNPILVFYKLKV